MTRKAANGLPAGFLDRLSCFETIALSNPAPQILLITLNRPKKLNAFDELMIREMRQVIWDANFDDDIRAIIITGAGRAFCAGRDIDGLHYENNLSTAEYRSYVRANHEVFDDMEAIEKPIIAEWDLRGRRRGDGHRMRFPRRLDERGVSASGKSARRHSCIRRLFSHDPNGRYRKIEGNDYGRAPLQGR
jgi:hypothetical protein